MSRANPFNAKRRTLELLRARGWVGDNVERRDKFGTRDFLGFADLVVAKTNIEGIPGTIREVPGREGYTQDAVARVVLAAVQVTTASNHAAHVRKVNAAEALRPALRAGYRVAIVSWDKVREGARDLWRVVRVTMFSLDGTGAATWTDVNPDPAAWA